MGKLLHEIINLINLIATKFVLLHPAETTLST